jgi:hypothetical protein
MIREPSFEAEQAEFYGEAIDALNRAGIRYMLGGALALHAYTGIWRDTKDLDIFVPEGVVEQVLEKFKAAGFETETTDPCWLAKAHSGDLFVDIIHASHNGTGPVDESWFAHSNEITLLERRVFVTPAEEMILSKIFVVAKDRCDVDDVLHLICRPRRSRLEPHASQDRRALGATPRLPSLLPLRIPESRPLLTRPASRVATRTLRANS